MLPEPENHKSQRRGMIYDGALTDRSYSSETPASLKFVPECFTRMWGPVALSPIYFRVIPLRLRHHMGA